MKVETKTTCQSLLFFAVCLALMFIGFTASESEAKTQLGVDIPQNEPVVKLAAVLENPDAFDGKKIVMKGIVSGQCPALCEFFFKDGIHSATIFSQGFKFPRLKTGKPVTIYTEIIRGEGQVVFSALGLEM